MQHYFVVKCVSLINLCMYKFSCAVDFNQKLLLSTLTERIWQREAGHRTDAENREGLDSRLREAGLRLDPDRERLDLDREGQDSRQREVGLKTCRSLFHKVVASYVLTVCVCLKACVYIFITNPASGKRICR